MAKHYTLDTRNKAIGMIEAGMTFVEVSRRLGMTTRTLKLWNKKVRAGKSLEDKPHF